MLLSYGAWSMSARGDHPPQGSLHPMGVCVRVSARVASRSTHTHTHIFAHTHACSRIAPSLASVTCEAFGRRVASARPLAVDGTRGASPSASQKGGGGGGRSPLFLSFSLSQLVRVHAGWVASQPEDVTVDVEAPCHIMGTGGQTKTLPLNFARCVARRAATRDHARVRGAGGVHAFSTTASPTTASEALAAASNCARRSATCRSSSASAAWMF